MDIFECQEDELDWLQKYSLIRRSNVTTAQRLCLLTLFAYAAKSWDKCYPSVKRIAHESLVSESTARRALSGLEKAGILIVTPQYRNGGRVNNKYEVVIEKLPQLEPYKVKMTPPPSCQNDTTPSCQNDTLINKSNKLLINNLDPSINSLTLTADAESGELFQENSEQEHSTSPERAKPQQTSSFDSNSISGEEKTPQPPARSTNADKMPCGDRYDRKQANRERAAASSYFEIGLKNKRWQDKADFDKFKAYAKVWAHNRQKDAQLNPDGTKYGDGYVNSILSRTAFTQDENDKDLICWKCWNQERSAQVFEQNPVPEPVVEVDEIERQRQIKSLTEKLENFKRQRAAEAAAQQAIEDEREARWAKLGWVN